MKKLENEYRQLMQNETPDLWERISAGIDAKIAEQKEEQQEEAQVESSEEQQEAHIEEQQPVKNKRQGVLLWKKYSLPLVACIAAVLCLPLMLTGFLRMAGGGSKSESAAADMAAPEAVYTTTTEAEDAPAEAYCEEAVMEESVIEEAETEEVVTEEAETEDANAGNTEMDGAASLETEKMAQDNEETIVLTVKDISQEITDMKDTEESLKAGTIYYMTTEEQGDCTVFVPKNQIFEPDSQPTLKILVKPGNGEYDYLFIEITE